MKEISEALIVVDLQYDFMPGGALPAKDGGEVVPVANHVARHFDLVVATQDWHPSNHGSFASQHVEKKPGDHIELAGVDQVLWPDHCVQHSAGAKIVDEFDVRLVDKIVHKGTDPQIDSYSTFFDNAHRRETGLHDFLSKKGVKRVYLLGLATDYCVKFSALDALHLGYETIVIVDGCRGVELEPGDSEKAFREMQEAGAHLIMSSEITARMK